MKRSHVFRSLAVLACTVGISVGLCMAEPVFASSWGSSNSNESKNTNSAPSNSGSSWGSSNSGNSNTPSNSGSSWGSSNAGNSKPSTNSGSSWGASNSGAPKQPANLYMPDPLTQISYADYQKMINQYRGKIVIVNFFATWCGPCRQEIADLKVLRTRFSEDDLIIISVSVDEKKSDLVALLRETNFNYPTAWASNELQNAFKIRSIPRMIIYDRQGGTWVDQEGLVPRDQFFDVIQKMVNF